MIDYCNTLFIGIFTLEAVIKIVALRKDYFSDWWNRFDFTITMLTDLLWLVKTFDLIIGGVSSVVSVLRVLRIIRILKLVVRAKKLVMIYRTL